MTKRQELIEKYGSITEAAKALSVPRSTLSDQVDKEDKGKKQAQGHGVKGRTIKEFRQLYDKDTIIPQKIKAGLESLGSGWLYEAEFMRHCGVRVVDFKAYQEQFAEYMVAVENDRRVVWTGSKTVAEELRRLA